LIFGPQQTIAITNEVPKQVPVHMSNDSAIETKSCTFTDEQQKHEVIFITLGDGDFTWSLDFGRYLFTAYDSLMNDGIVDGKRTNVRLIATGIDSLNEFQQKYRNYNYILRELEKLNTKSRTDDDYCMQVEVLHEINAIIDSSGNDTTQKQGHVVIFNHPHLGREDAKLHSQFLCHLFHSVNQFWITVGGVFHLTLANGQYERWQCHTAAKRHGMKLLQQSTFIPNPSIDNFKSVYGHRRHQTGKSFASRTSGSTTYTFIRECDDTNSIIHSVAHIQLPWFKRNDNCSKDEGNALEASCFICSLCDKQFREERSLMNHMTSVHKNKRKRTEHDAAKFVCNQCNIRSFDTSEALNDHMLAKHNGIHSTIMPDWLCHSGTSSNLTNKPNTIQLCGTCTICDAVFGSFDNENDHYKSFIPSLIDTLTKVEMIQCRFCRKSFQQVRAQQQHENFCSSRLRE
jgi:Domain of unknown function (DUF2431)/Zinc-finger double-stranded RNA-binding/Zinc finger, C2H2 type